MFRCLKTKDLKMLVIDEADEMLGRGFKEQLYDIYRYLPPETQVLTPPPPRAPVFTHTHVLRRVPYRFLLVWIGNPRPVCP